MKYLISCLSICFFLLIACNEPPSVAHLQKTPEEAAKAFFEALSQQNIAKASALASPSTQRQVRLFFADLNMSSEEERKEKLREIELNLKSIDCKEQGGKMMCKICCALNDAEAEVEMVQQEGKWAVQHSFGFEE